MLIQTLFNPGDTVYINDNGIVRKRRVWWLEVMCKDLRDEAFVTYFVSAKSPYAAVGVSERFVFKTAEEAEASS